MTRQDHKYVNLPRQLVEVVDECVAGICKNGTQIYANRKDFVIKSIIHQIDNEKNINQTLAKKLNKKISVIEESQERKKILTIPKTEVVGGGNRSKNVY